MVEKILFGNCLNLHTCNMLQKSLEQVSVIQIGYIFSFFSSVRPFSYILIFITLHTDIQIKKNIIPFFLLWYP